MKRFPVRKVAVLGAGVMGAQIAAHLANVRVPVVLFDLPAKDGPKNGIVSRAVDGLKKQKPAPLGVADDAALIGQANYEEHLEQLRGCDLIIEAIAERMDWKLDLYTRIAPYIAPHAIVASNTSGLSIGRLSEVLPESIQPRFCGIHFFNPPRYMALVELIPTPRTRPDLLDPLEAFVTSVLGKNVVRANDTPNFIANRVGIAGMLSVMTQAETFGLTYDVVDDLTGRKLGRASSGTFRTADVVGLDTLAHVIKTLQDQLGPHALNDPFYPNYATPKVIATLIERGALGSKTGAGFYKKVGKDILRLDPDSFDYVQGGGQADDIIGRMLKKPPAERLKLLRESSHPQAQFLWAVLRDSFHYSAVHLSEVAHCARDIDFAIRWGFGSQQGPFELWQAAGWSTVANWVQDDIDHGRALCHEPLPKWVFEGSVAERGGVHQPEGSWSAATASFVAASDLPVYRRQHFRESVYGSGAPLPLASGEELFKTDELRVWTLDGEVLIASITTKLHLLTTSLAEALVRALTLAEEDFKGLVIWSPDEVFSAGANLEVLMPAFMASGAAGIEPAIVALQQAFMRLRYATVPVVAAIRGMALGGGCELAVHCARRVAAMESYIGLVEVGVGLIPGAGGLTFIARRAAEMASMGQGQAQGQSDLVPFLRAGFGHAALGQVSTSALEARRFGYLLEGDVIVPHKDELLFVAITQARAMADSGYQPPVRAQFPVAGRDGAATIRGQLVNLRDGGQISAYDFHIASAMAEVLCGGDVDSGTLVGEATLMALERRHFCALLDDPRTQERITGMLATGKPVRN